MTDDVISQRAVRVAKLMARRGLCSRRQAERLIEAGQVVVNGLVVAQQGCKAPPDAQIEIRPEGVTSLGALVTVLLHKPRGVVSGRWEPGQIPAWHLLRADTLHGEVDESVRDTVLANPASFSVAGRLDRDSRGLLVLTQDGAVARRLIDGHEMTKTYEVHVHRPVSTAQLRKLNGPLTLDGKRLLPMRVRQLAPTVLRFDLIEGRKHQIRRVCRRVGLAVIDLCRIAIGPFRLAGLPEGCWRPASDVELAELHLGSQGSPPRRGAVTATSRS